MTDKPATTETPAAATPPAPTVANDAPGAATPGVATSDAAAPEGATPSGAATTDQPQPAPADAPAPTPAGQPQPQSQPAEPPVPRGPRRSEPMDLAVIVAAMVAMVALGAGLATGSFLVGLVVLAAGGLLAVAVHRISTRAFRSAQ